MMKKFNTLFSFLLIFCAAANASAQDRFYKMSRQQIDSLLTVTASQSKTITEKMNELSQFFLETPYDFTCVGDGLDALYEPYPLVNFQETNCMAFCEHVLALSISDSWDNFFNNLQQIRYQDGIIGMRTRNHYTMADWLPQNSWLLEDVTAKIGKALTESVTRTISHKKFFENKGITDLRYVKPDRKITIQYIPSKELGSVMDSLRIGDIGALIYKNKNNIFSAHMFMIAGKNDQIFIREASTSKMTTFDTPFSIWVKKIERSERYMGVSFMRIRDELNQAGKIILPWEIHRLKQK